MKQFACPATIYRMIVFIAALLMSLMMASIALGQNDEKTITVNVDTGVSEKNNVGAGFGLIEKLDTQLNIELTSEKGVIKSSEVVAAAPGVNWVKVTETHWRAAGVGPNDPFWCVIKCTLEIPDGEGDGKPPERWMSVSYVDLDADTDNDSGAVHRPPSRSEDEDHHEFPGVIASDVIGLIVPINDNNDVGWNVRDGFIDDMNRDQDPDVMDFVLEIRPRQAGKWWVSHLGGKMFSEDGEPVKLEHLIDINQDETFNLRFKASWDSESGTRYISRAEFTTDSIVTTFDPCDYLNYILLSCDIDVDSNNDGNILGINGNDNGEDFWETHPVDDVAYANHPEYKFGMIVAVNDDDDDNDGYPDNGWNGTDWTGDNATSIRGNDDLKDLRRGILRALGVEDEAVKAMIDEFEPVLVIKKVSGPGAIRLFTESGHHHIGAFIDDGDSVNAIDEMPLWDQLYGVGDMGFLVEGLQAGEVILRYQLWVKDRLIHHDEVRITVISLYFRADTDRDGEVTIDDEKDKNSWSTGPTGRGAIVLANYDKNGTGAAPDNYNTFVDEGNDRLDLAELHLSKLGITEIPDDLQITLIVEKPVNEPASTFLDQFEGEFRVRIFLPTTTEGNNLVVTEGDEEIFGPDIGW